MQRHVGQVWGILQDLEHYVNVENKSISGKVNSIFLTIIIPAYNEERRLRHTLPQVVEFVGSQPYQAEILVVENGSTDRTAEVVEEFAAKSPCIRLLRSKEAGKGRAIKLGMLQARGEYGFICDADLAMPISELPKFLPPQQNGFQIAIGSREAMGAVRYNEPGYRHLMGRVYNSLIKIMAVSGFEDTQCGFKCFHKSVIADLFSHQTIEGFGFDVELLYVAQKRGYRVVEVPIDWYYQSESKVRPIQDTIGMIQDLIKVRQNDWQGLYDRD